MTFDEFIQDGLGKANKLFAKLAQTGPNAVKTRERLFLDLKAELNHLNRFERHHLIPALGDQKKTRALVKALEQDGEKVAELLAELETAPRAGDAFLQKLTDLQGAFQAHVRDERRELLPAVLDALHKAQSAEQEAAEREAADLAAAELKAAELKAAQAEAEVEAALKAQHPVETPAVEPPAVETAPLPETKAVEVPPPAPLEPKHTSASIEPAAAPHETVEKLAPLATPAPLAAIAMLHAVATPPAPISVKPPEALAVPLTMSLASPAYGVQAWANLMQEAASGAMIGYKLMLAYSNNTGFAALQTRLMKEQVELMTKSGAKMVEAAQRLARTLTPN